MTGSRLSDRLVAPAQMCADDLHATPESIAAAKLACLRERAQVFEQTGVRIDRDGRVQLPSLIDSMQRMSNWFAAALYGTSGELRDRVLPRTRGQV